MKLYLAGPLFTTPERTWNEAMAARLETHGHEVYVPHLHPAPDHSATSIFRKDNEGIGWADGFVAMDGAPTRTPAPAGSAATRAPPRLAGGGRRRGRRGAREARRLSRPLAQPDPRATASW